MERQTSQNNVLHLLIGREMSSVEFVRDYVQLRFDGITFTLYNYPIVIANGVQYNINKPGYRDSLCSLISKGVNDFQVVEQEHIKLFFSNGIVLLITLCMEDYKGPEVAMLTTENNVIQVW